MYRGQSTEDRRRDRRRRFCAAGVDLFGTDGYLPTSVAAVCRRAGLSSRQFYEEFADREALLVAVYDAAEDGAMTAVQDAVVAALTTADEIEAVLDAGISAFIEHFAADPRLTRICFVEVVGVSPALEAHRSQRRAQWATLLKTAAAGGVERGLIAGDTDPLMWTGFIGAVNAVIVEQAASDSLTTDDALRVMRKLLRPGLLG